jgi:hypothetical protein
MEDLLLFLLIVGVIGYIVFRKMKRDRKFKDK